MREIDPPTDSIVWQNEGMMSSLASENIDTTVEKLSREQDYDFLIKRRDGNSDHHMLTHIVVQHDQWSDSNGERTLIKYIGLRMGDVEVLSVISAYMKGRQHATENQQ